MLGKVITTALPRQTRAFAVSKQNLQRQLMSASKQLGKNGNLIGNAGCSVFVLYFFKLIHISSLAGAGSKIWARLLRFSQPYRFREYGSNLESFEYHEVSCNWHTAYLFAVRCYSPLVRIILTQYQIQLCFPFTLDNSIDFTPSTSPGITYILIPQLEAWRRPQTLGMRQSFPHKTFSNRWRCWTEWRWWSMCDDRWEVSATGRYGRQLRRYCEACMGNWSLAPRDKSRLNYHSTVEPLLIRFHSFWTTRSRLRIKYLCCWQWRRIA